MPDRENEKETRTLLRSACKPMRASLQFKAELYDQIVRRTNSARSNSWRILGLNPSTWVAIGSVVAVGLIVYGVLSVPEPAVVIESVPPPPQSQLSTPLV